MAGREFYTILTETGKSKIADAAVLGTKINFITLKVGDGNGSYYEPGEAQVDLMHTVWSGPITNVSIDSNNSNWVVVDSLIPNDVGAFVIREVGIFDDNQDMLAVAKHPETYKPIVSNGASKEVRIKLILEVSNTASISLEVNPNAAATQEDIENLAGEGRTTETVKENADAIANLQGEINDMKNSCGTGTFNGTAGVIINHNAGTSNYIVQITISSPDPTGAIGIFWTESKADTSFIVKNTGDTGFRFDWVLIKLSA